VQEAVLTHSVAVVAMPDARLVVDTEVNCQTVGATAIVSTSRAANATHWLSAGLIFFARGWNDTPKIAALSVLALAAVPHGMALGFVLTAVAMAAGGLLAGFRVLNTLSKRLTTLPLAESLTASLVTATLVSEASWLALPVSTTHVTTGAIIGAGLKH